MGTSLLRVVAVNLGRFCTGPSPPSTLSLTQCAALTVSTDGSQVQRAELDTAHRAARPLSKLTSCGMCRAGRCRGCRWRISAGGPQPSIVWPSPTRVDQEASRASVSARLGLLLAVCFVPLLLVFRRGARMQLDSGTLLLWERAGIESACQGSAAHGQERNKTVCRAPCGKVAIFTVWEWHLETAPRKFSIGARRSPSALTLPVTLARG